MKTAWKTRSALVLATASLVTVGWTTTVSAAPTPTPTPTPTASATADATLITNLTYMRDEERLALDIYTAMTAKYAQAAPFANIARSEQVHFDTMGLLLTRYGVADPSTGNNPGSYADPALQSLYDKLLASGNESLERAYDVGIAVENLDIADLKAAIAQTGQADVKAALTNLMNGSTNHLSAFTAAKNGQILGARSGQGMQNGRSSAKTAEQGRNGRGQGMNSGTGDGLGQRATTRPTTCPLR